MTFSKQIIRPKLTFSKEIIFLRGEEIGIFYTCEVFDVFELFEVGGGIKYASSNFANFEEFASAHITFSKVQANCSLVNRHFYILYLQSLQSE